MSTSLEETNQGGGNRDNLDWDLDIILAAIEAVHDAQVTSSSYSEDDFDHSSEPTVIPRPEWVIYDNYPDERSNVRQLNENDDNMNNDIDPEFASIMNTPIQTSIQETVPTKRCYFKIWGFTVCDDDFQTTLNPNIYKIMIGILIIMMLLGMFW